MFINLKEIDMKNLISTALLTMVMSLPMTSFAQYNSSGSSGQTGQADNAPSIINGTVVSVDHATGKITVNDSLNKTEKILTDPKKEDLSNIKTGDKVIVTLQADGSVKAVKIVE
jgi:Cu/Ag efflux protein CusF